MDIKFPWDTARKIRALENIPNRTPQQEARLQKLYQSYSTGKTTYTPPLTYPTKNVSVRREDVLFRDKYEWTRANSRNINSSIDYDYIADHNFALQEQFPRGTLETRKHYHDRLVAEIQKRKTNLDLLQSPVPSYNPTPMANHFPQGKFDPSKPVFTTLDIETDDYQNPISIAASRLQWNDRYKRYEAIDSFQRFYPTSNSNLVATYGTHGMTSAALTMLKVQQGLKYSMHYNDKERQALAEYLGNSTIIGQNITIFDLPILFGNNPIPNSTIDTVHAARSIWPEQKNSLDYIYYRIFGHTMEQDGLSHHDPNADIIAAAKIAEWMANHGGIVGQSIQHVMKSSGTAHIAEWNDMMTSMVTTGNYRDMFRDNDLYEVYMSKKEVNIDDVLNEMIGPHKEFSTSNLDIDDRSQIQQLTENVNAIAGIVGQLVAGQNPSLHGKGHGGISSTQRERVEDDLFTAVNTFNKYKQLSLVQKIATVKSPDSLEALRRASGLGDSIWDSYANLAQGIRDAHEVDQIRAQRKVIQQMRERGQISKSDYVHLTSLKGSYDDLVDATDKVVEANKRLMNVYQAIAEIRPYDINNLISEAHNQWSGIKGAAHGVVPNFILNPISRLGDAAFNDINKKMAPWNAMQRIYQETLGKVLKKATGTDNVGGALASHGFDTRLGWGVGIGVVRAGEQVAGNIAQAHITMRGQDIQNSLNTLGAMVSWISTPFRLLHKALKLAIGSLGGFTFKLNNFMGSGIGLMSQMGNPLTPLTGVNYNAYAGSTMMDVASLMSKGSANAAYNDFAYQQQALYMGQYDVNRMIAASILGVYDTVYGGKGGNSQAGYNSMANKLLNDLKMNEGNLDAQARIMERASIINSNLPDLLQTARLLNISDVNVLNNPQNRGMYWRPIDDTIKDARGLTEAGRFRWTQYEYGAAREQMGYSKMRLSNTLWNAGGKTIYNAFNEIVDRVAGGDITGAVKRASEIWGEFATKFKGTWETIKASSSGEGGEQNNIAKTFKAIGLQLTNVVIDVGMKIIEIWDAIMLTALRKAQGLIAYLSTIHVDVYKDKNGFGLNITSIKDAKYDDSETLYEEGAYGGVAAHSGIAQAKEGMEPLIKLANMFGIYGKTGSFAMPGYNPTVGDIKDAIRSYREKYGLEAITLPEGFPMEQIGTDEASINALFNNIAQHNWGRAGAMEAAASAFLTPETDFMVYDKQKEYDKTGLYDVGEKFITGTEDAARTALMGIRNANMRAIAELRFTDSTGKKASLMADTKEGVLTRDITLLQQMVPEGYKLVVNQLR